MLGLIQLERLLHLVMLHSGDTSWQCLHGTNLKKCQSSTDTGIIDLVFKPSTFSTPLNLVVIQPHSKEDIFKTKSLHISTHVMNTRNSRTSRTFMLLTMCSFQKSLILKMRRRTLTSMSIKSLLKSTITLELNQLRPKEVKSFSMRRVPSCKE